MQQVNAEIERLHRQGGLDGRDYEKLFNDAHRVQTCYGLSVKVLVIHLNRRFLDGISGRRIKQRRFSGKLDAMDPQDDSLVLFVITTK